MTTAPPHDAQFGQRTGWRWSVLLRPLSPTIETARNYSRRKLRKDLFAGLTVSVVEVPQSMAYALIAGVPAQYGLYTSVLQGIIGALLSSSEHMTTGPTNTQSLLIASAVHRMIAPDAPPEHYLEMVFALTFLKGLIQLAFAAARMGNLVRYVSRSVISGLVSGAGVLIFCGQLPALLGVPAERSDLPGVLASIVRVVHGFRAIDSASLCIGVAVIAAVLGVQRVSKLLPGPLLAITLSALMVYAFGWTAGSPHLIDPLPRGVPHFQLPCPGWQNAEALLGGALALAIVGMLESVAIAKSIAARTGEEISANQEFFAQGLKNTLTSFFQCIPGSGSFTRSALDYAAGAETRFAAVFNACFVGCLFWLLADEARFIPRASLAGVLIVIGFGLIDWRYIPRVLRASRADAAVWLTTFGATLVVPLEYAIFIGVFFNIGLYLRTAGRLHINEILEADRPEKFREVNLTDRGGRQAVILLQVEGDLLFPVCDELADRLKRLALSGVRIAILRLRQVHSIDATALHVLEDFVNEMKTRDRQLILCGLRPKLLYTIEQFGLVEAIGSEHCFDVELGIFDSVHRALRHAEELLDRSIDVEDFSNLESRWLYQI